jgi:hypothetical protein
VLLLALSNRIAADERPAAAPRSATVEAAEAPSSDELRAALEALRSVGPRGRNHAEAQAAWRHVATVRPEQLPQVLAGLDGSGQLSANWIRTAVEAVAERALQSGGKLPAARFEAFVLDRRHGPQGRELAYDWLVRVDPGAADRLLPDMLDDPSAALRRKAVARRIDAAEQSLEAGRSAQAVATFRDALTAARDEDQVRAIAGHLKKLGQEVDLARHFGFVTRWRVTGPFDNTGEAGFDRVYPPERELDFNATYRGKHGSLTWQEHTSEHRFGRLDFNKVLGEEKAVVGYGATRFVADRSRDVELRYSSFNAVKVWLNGSLVGSHDIYHSGSQFDQYVSRVTLAEGPNQILVKVCQNEQTQSWADKWHIQLRVCDEIGGAVLSADRPKTEKP